MVDLTHLSDQERGALKQFEQEVDRICGGSGYQLRLFGSRARQEGDEESDLDLLVLLDNYDEETKVKIWDASYTVFSQTDVLLSPLVLSRNQFERLKERERLIARDIERDGIVL